MRRPRFKLWLPFVLLLTFDLSARAEEPKRDFFEQKIRPILVRHCYECHSHESDGVEASLYLDSRDALRAGGDTGPAVVPGDPAKSLLLQALRYEELEMPPDAPLPQHVVNDFATWIKAGAFDPREGVAQSHRPNYEEARKYWAFRPIRKPQVPSVKRQDWPATGIDSFVLAKLERRGLRPAAPAPRGQLIRRVYFDLLGLPPTPAEISAFENSNSAAAYEELVDRLLASPRYGERWGQHWLDVVRYAETEGFEYDRLLSGAWRYRDYVIESLNEDKPYDLFVLEQLAGDELADNPTLPDHQKLKVAAGFHRLGTVRRNAGNQEVASSRNEVLTERTDIIGSVFLGLTVGCARCHDHKFDPITQQDYYRLQVYFAGTREDNFVLASAEEQAEWKSETDRIQNQIDKLKEELTSQRGDTAVATRAEIDGLTDSLPAPLPMLCSITNDRENATPIHVLRRGSPDHPLAQVGLRPLAVLVDDQLPELPADAEYPRRKLAEWINAEDHPLTTRVIVNRIWQFHFGEGLVRTPNDFGRNGATPTHAELLDWLAARFLDSGRQLKLLHRSILLSQTYQQSAANSDDRAMQVDPENELLWHFPRRRLSPEEIRDAMLLYSGELSTEQGGPSVTLPVDEQLVAQLYKEKQWVVSPSHQHGRRSIYLLAKRNLRLPFMEVFDQPTAQTSCACREQSTHAPQALELLNGRTSNRLAKSLAQRIREEVGNDVSRQVAHAYRLVTGRPPNEREGALGRDFIDSVSLEEFALAMFNLNSFLYVD